MTFKPFACGLLVVACTGSGTGGATDAGSDAGGFAPYDAGCAAPGDGARVAYNGPFVWIPDCTNPLRREYWRVGQAGDAIGFTLPRVDFAPDMRALCTESTELVPVLEHYGLCPEPTNASPSVVNAMLIPDALRVTHALHLRLRFAVVDGGTPGISPYPMPSDVLDACALRDAGPMEEICSFWRQRVVDGQALGIQYTGPGADELARRLNELYGIPPP